MFSDNKTWEICANVGCIERFSATDNHNQIEGDILERGKLISSISIRIEGKGGRP
jgi:hypothetical protein